MAFTTKSTEQTITLAPKATTSSRDLSALKPGDELSRAEAQQVQDTLLENSLGVPAALAEMCITAFEETGGAPVETTAKVLKHQLAYSARTNKNYSTTKVVVDVDGVQYKLNVLFVPADKGATVKLVFSPISTDISRSGVQCTATPQ
jgi:hypothetical protein